MTSHDKAEQERARRFRDLALPCLDDAYSLAHVLMRNRTDAEDAVQECYLRALRHFGSWRGDLAKGNTIKPWLFAILRNVCYSELNRRRRQETPTDLADDKYSAEPLVWQEPQSLPEADIADRQESAAVRHLVTTLPEVYREAIVLREYDDMSYREISEVTGVPIGTVMSRLARARAMLLKGWKARDKQHQPQGGRPLSPRSRGLPTVVARR